ncbi:MAG TPA: site-specific DNA-methyltransferase [Nitrososphaera sp.]|jgi:site-specific DNA-methyltransferase (adenine-specific)|nr:site-specific DNA-methyltransferase [uncultured Nitrososphaera sp.]
MADRKRAPTRTSDFGVSRRESHDSSRFYSRRLYSNGNGKEGGAGLPENNNSVPEKALDRIFCKSSEKMDELPDKSVHLAVTSPPYNVGKEYDGDLTMEQYRALLKSVFSELYRVLADGGRACINVANLGRKPYIPLHSYVIQDMLACGFLMRGEVIWDKGSSAGASTAWGSWQSASNPTLRDVHEYVLVFSKGSFSRKPAAGSKNTISKEEFLEYTKSVWAFQAESAKKVGHPAPFPVELPYRCIQLYTFAGDVILDPFCGVGSSCIAALKAGRHFVGYDTSEQYVQAAQARLRTFRQQKGNIPF